MLIPFEVSERLEKYFTVCYWEQRGAGISFNKSITSGFTQAGVQARLTQSR